MLVAAREAGLGIALKCEDGTTRAVAPATVAVLDHLGLLDDGERRSLAPLRRPVVANVVGTEVGFLEAGLREVALA